MDRYIVFHYLEYYPCGGFQDYIGKRKKLEAVKETCIEYIVNEGEIRGSFEVVDMCLFKKVIIEAEDVVACDFNKLTWCKIEPKA